MNRAQFAARIREFAAARGFAVTGFTSASILGEGEALGRWLGLGFQADMKWMQNREKRENPRAFFPGAKSVVVAGWNCYLPARSGAAVAGRAARFSFGEDYHSLIGERLKEVLGYMTALTGCSGRVAVDSAPLLEKALARRAGLGWIGRNSCLINPRYSSWLLLGEIVTDAEIEEDEPFAADRCGTCERCVRACPTGAIMDGRFVDSQRCIAYLTIENRGGIPRELRPSLKDRVFGCDLCQEICPWNRFAVPRPDLHEPAELDARDFLSMGEEEFKRRFSKTAIMRAGRVGMARNAAVVLGNSPRPGAEDLLASALGDASPLVRAHAAWALGRLGRFSELSARKSGETDPGVLEEIGRALGGGA